MLYAQLVRSFRFRIVLTLIYFQPLRLGITQPMERVRLRTSGTISMTVLCKRRLQQKANSLLPTSSSTNEKV